MNFQILRPRFLRVSVSLLAATILVTPALAEDPVKPEVAPTRGKEVLIIKESRDAQTFNAEDQDVTVQGSNNRVTIKGNCHALSVSGNQNQVSVASVVSIAVSGDGNHIVWNKASGGEKPQVTDLGKDNSVSHAAAKD